MLSFIKLTNYRLQMKMRTNLEMAKDRLDFLSMNFRFECCACITFNRGFHSCVLYSL